MLMGKKEGCVYAHLSENATRRAVDLITFKPELGAKSVAKLLIHNESEQSMCTLENSLNNLQHWFNLLPRNSNKDRKTPLDILLEWTGKSI